MRMLLFNISIVLSVFLHVSLGASEHLVQSLQVEKNVIRVVPNKLFKEKYLYDDFIAEYDQSCDFSELDQSIVIVPFIMSVISLIWESGQSWEIESLDRELALSLDTIKNVYKVFYPDISWDGQLIIKKLVDNQLDTKNKSMHTPVMANLFSGGLDSLCTSFAHRDKKQLLLTYWGFSAEISLTNAERWQAVQEQVRDYAQTYHHENSFVHSNFRSYICIDKLHTRYPCMINWLEFCQESISQVGLAIPLLYQRGITRMYIPSSRTKSYLYPWGSHPFIDDNITCAGIQVHHDGYNLTRQGKINLVVRACIDDNVTRPTMFVCRMRNHQMCTSCEKCLQTMVGVLVEGVLPEEYGFRRSAERVMNLMRLRIEKNKLRVTHVAIWHWHNIQERIRQIMQTPDGLSTYDAQIRVFLLWLLSIDFESLPHKKPLLPEVDWQQHSHFYRFY